MALPLPLYVSNCSIALPAVRSAYSSWRLRLPVLPRSRPPSNSGLNLLERHAAAGGMFRPRHVPYEDRRHKRDSRETY
jgi:hypothetical protein